mgnify:CR=1 FL=1
MLYETRNPLTGLGRPSSFLLIPLVIVAAAAIGLPRASIRRQEGVVFRLRLAALVTLGLAPFFGWQTIAHRNPYLTIQGILAVLAGIWLLMTTAAYLQRVFAAAAAPKLAARADNTRKLIGYAYITPVAVLYVFLGRQLLISTAPAVRLLTYAWAHAHLLIRLAVTTVLSAPLLCLLYLLWQAHRVTLDRLTEERRN